MWYLSLPCFSFAHPWEFSSFPITWSIFPQFIHHGTVCEPSTEPPIIKLISYNTFFRFWVIVSVAYLFNWAFVCRLTCRSSVEPWRGQGTGGDRAHRGARVRVFGATETIGHRPQLVSGPGTAKSKTVTSAGLILVYKKQRRRHKWDVTSINNYWRAAWSTVILTEIKPKGFHQKLNWIISVLPFISSLRKGNKKWIKSAAF